MQYTTNMNFDQLFLVQYFYLKGLMNNLSFLKNQEA